MGHIPIELYKRHFSNRTLQLSVNLHFLPSMAFFEIACRVLKSARRGYSCAHGSFVLNAFHLTDWTPEQSPQGHRAWSVLIYTTSLCALLISRNLVLPTQHASRSAQLSSPSRSPYQWKQALSDSGMLNKSGLVQNSPNSSSRGPTFLCHSARSISFLVFYHKTTASYMIKQVLPCSNHIYSHFLLSLSAFKTSIMLFYCRLST